MMLLGMRLGVRAVGNRLVGFQICVRERSADNSVHRSLARASSLAYP